MKKIVILSFLLGIGAFSIGYWRGLMDADSVRATDKAEQESKHVHTWGKWQIVENTYSFDGHPKEKRQCTECGETVMKTIQVQ